MTDSVGYFIGSLSEKSINRILSKALVKLAPAQLELREIPIKDLPLYNRDLDGNYPPETQALKDAIAEVDAVLFVMPEIQPRRPGTAEERDRLGQPPVG
jgi:chromate reductase